MSETLLLLDNPGVAALSLGGLSAADPGQGESLDTFQPPEVLEAPMLPIRPVNYL
jgi:hypothetical protein